MLNLAQIRQQVKEMDVDPSHVRLNSAHPNGANEAYRQLKAAGWTSDLEVHPTDRTPVLRRGERANIRRNPRAGGWIITIDGQEHEFGNEPISTLTRWTDAALADDPSGRAEVVYDRSAREWQVRNGKLLGSYPAGTQGQYWAKLRALEHNAPRLSAAVEEIAYRHGHAEALVSRLLRAADMIEAGLVYSNGRVASQSSADVYNTAWDVCDCPDFEFGKQRAAGLIDHGGVDTDLAEWPVCKHILAQRLAEMAEVELYDEPIPFGVR